MGVIVFLLGITIGSFLNVCIYRIPKGTSIVYPASHCPTCKTGLKWHDLIPVISFLMQKGKCRYCGGRIAPQYPVVELLNAIFYTLLYGRFGLGIDFLFYGAIFSILIVISLIDLYHQIIPNPLNLSILILAVTYKIFQFMFIGSSFNIIDNILGLVVSGSIFLLIAIVSKGGMGGGDIKLIAALGFILGLRKSLLNIFLSFILGAFISIFLLLFKIKGRKDAIAFGPFICLAFILTLFWGDGILAWYMKIAGIMY